MKNMSFSLFCKFLKICDSSEVKWIQYKGSDDLFVSYSLQWWGPVKLFCCCTALSFCCEIQSLHLTLPNSLRLPSASMILPSETFIRAEKLILATFLFLGNIKLFLINPVDIFGYWHCSLKYKIYGHKAAFWRNLS